MLLTENVESFIDEQSFIDPEEDNLSVSEDYSIEEVIEMLEFLDQEELNDLGEALYETIEGMLDEMFYEDEESEDEEDIDEVLSTAQIKRNSMKRKKNLGKRIKTKMKKLKATRGSRKGELMKQKRLKKRWKAKNVAKVNRHKKNRAQATKGSSYFTRHHKK
jgi:hypothetical protein